MKARLERHDGEEVSVVEMNINGWKTTETDLRIMTDNRVYVIPWQRVVFFTVESGQETL